jgi:hypothetical protein
MSVTVQALRFHSHLGEDHQPGDQYEVDEADVDNLRNQRMAVPVDEAPTSPIDDEPAA